MMNNGNITALRNADGSIDFTVSYTVNSENELFCRDDIDCIKIKEDGIWYYLHLGLFFIKIPVEYLERNYSVIDDSVWKSIEGYIISFILNDYYGSDESFRAFIKDNNYNISDIKQDTAKADTCVEKFCDKYYDLVEYFDEWVIIIADTSNSRIEGIKLMPRKDKHIETYNWE